MTELPAGPRLRAAVLAAAALLYLLGLGWVDAAAPDEPRYLQVAEEMRSGVHGIEGLVLMHLNGEVYTQKPPLYFWLAAAFGAPFGHVSELAARLPSALAGLLCVLLTLRLGTRLFGSGGGVLGAALLLTVFEFAHLARRVQLDVLLTACELSALAGFWSVDRGLGPRRRGVVILHAAMALGILTKGPVAFLLPLLGIVAFLAWEGRLRDLRRAFPPWGLLISLGPGIAWIAAANALAPAGFADDALGENLIGRFFRGTSHARPFFYYLYHFPIDFLPWTLLWPGVAWVARHRVFGVRTGTGEPRRRAWRLLLSWVGASLVFFSLSSGKRGLYLAPIFPLAALLCADACIRGLSGRTRLPRAAAAVAASFAGLVFLIGVEALAAGTGHPLAPIARWREMVPELDRGFLLAFGSALVGVSCAGAMAWLVFARNRAPVLGYLGVAISTVFGVELAVFTLLYPALDPIRSPRAIAQLAARMTPPGEEIGLVGDRAMAGGLAYYSRRRIRELETPEEIQAFLAAGGHTFVAKRRKLDRVEAFTPLAIVGRARTGRREVVVAIPAGDPSSRPGGGGTGSSRSPPSPSEREGGGAMQQGSRRPGIGCARLSSALPWAKFPNASSRRS